MDAGFWQLFRTTSNPMGLLDDERRYVEANEACLRFMGLSREELLGRRVDDFVPGEIDPSGWHEFLRRGSGWGRYRYTLPDGREQDFFYSATANVAPGRHLGMVLLDVEPDAAAPALSEREREVMSRVARGETTRQIADGLVLSPTTVESHVRRAVARLGARNRAHAIALALVRGELEIPQDGG